MSHSLAKGKDHVGISLTLLAGGMVVLPYFTHLTTQLTGMDLVTVSSAVFGVEEGNTIFIMLVRQSFFIAYVSLARFWAVLICGGIIILSMGITSFKNMTLLDGYPRRVLHPKYFNRFQKLRIAYCQFNMFSSYVAAFLFLVGFAICIVFLVITFKFYGTLDLLVYLIYPSVGLITLVVIKIILKMAEDVFESSSIVIRTFQKMARNSAATAVHRKQAQSLRAPKINVGINGYNFFYVSKSTKTVYYQTIIDYVINVLLLDS